MAKYIFKRTLQSLLSVFIVVFVVFLLLGHCHAHQKSENQRDEHAHYAEVERIGDLFRQNIRNGAVGLEHVGLAEVAVEEVDHEFAEKLEYLRGLDKRRDEIRSLIDAQEKLTDEINLALDKAATLSELEDIYRPYRPKRKTRASIAKEKGLEPS